jgi:hypothetical protein
MSKPESGDKLLDKLSPPIPNLHFTSVADSTSLCLARQSAKTQMEQRLLIELCYRQNRPNAGQTRAG